VIVRNQKELDGLLRIGQICGQTLLHMAKHVEPGITTRALDEIGAAFLQKHNARSAPITAYKYPGWTCISVNEEVAHGIPGDRVIQAGDLVNIDVSAVLENYWGDTGATMLVPPGLPAHQQLADQTVRALQAGIQAAKANMPIYEIGRSIENVAKKGGYNLIRELAGHGVGRNIHESPNVFSYFTRKLREPLVEGLVITIEPFLTRGKGRIYTAKDGWTLRTIDKVVAAQYEHTVVIAGDSPILVTKTDETWW
jgi:methionyl aminopeptidase